MWFGNYLSHTTFLPVHPASHSIFKFFSVNFQIPDITSFLLRLQIASGKARTLSGLDESERNTHVNTRHTQSIKHDDMTKTAKIPCPDLALNYKYLPDFSKIKQIETGKEFAHVSVEMAEPATTPASRFIGVDCNTTGHCAVVTIHHTGKIHKPGKMAIHTRKKYRGIRAKLQKQGKSQLLRQIKHREKNIIRSLNHKISKNW